MDPQLVQTIGDVLRAARRVLIVTHVNPDGDALGSLTAAALMVYYLGGEPYLAVEGGMLTRYDYLPLAGSVRNRFAHDMLPLDLLISVDCADMERMGEIIAQIPGRRPPILNIDHHITNTQFGQWNLVPPTATATTEVLYDICQALDIPIDEPLAVSLLTGIVTDTQSFRTSNVTPRALQIAGELMAAGADLPGITLRTLGIKSYNTIKMWREGLNNLRLEDGLAWTTIGRHDRQRANYDGTGNAGLVGLIANIEEAVIGVVLLELEDGRVSVSWRSRLPYEVATVALALGGGGHPQASGCTTEGPLSKAVAEVIERTKASLLAQRLGVHAA